MKKQTLLLLALGAGALLLLSMKRRPKGRVIVPEPERITEAEFIAPKPTPGLVEKLAPIVKSIVAKRKERRAAKRVGFPDFY